MEVSPLKQEVRPDTFEPKVVQLYRQLLRVADDDEKPAGFWRELFLLKPDVDKLGEMLEDIDAMTLLHLEHQSQQLLLHGIASIKEGKGPADENALDTLTVFLAKVLSKRYTNPSSDIIEVLAGLDDVDSVFTDLVATLDTAIKSGQNISLRQKAVQVSLSVASGAFQTSLLTYFTQRDLFPSLMKLIHDLEDPLAATRSFLLAGLLANYNKFESRNPYHVRFADFVNDDTTKKIARSCSKTCVYLRDQYVTIQEDMPEAWSIGGTFSYIGLGALTGTKPAAPVLPEDEMRARFSEQPKSEAASLLAMYDFVIANKIFCTELVQPYTDNKQQTTNLSSYLSLCSYLYQHAHRSSRVASYAHLTLLILQILVEDPGVAKRIAETTCAVRLCRQRQPFLPLIRTERTLAANIIDTMVDSINHNLRRKIDVDLYLLNIGILLQLVSFLSRSRIRLAYHWSELWRSLLSFVRFLTVYADDVKSIYRSDLLVNNLTNLITFSLTQGESFLPDSASYDDLFYKLVEFGDSLVKFRDAYSLTGSHDGAAAMGNLIGVSKHYSDLIASEKKSGKNLSPREVSRIIKEGYETLSIQAKEGLDHWDKYREADHKVILKKIVRVVVVDATELSQASSR